MGLPRGFCIIVGKVEDQMGEVQPLIIKASSQEFKENVESFDKKDKKRRKFKKRSIEALLIITQVPNY